MEWRFVKDYKDLTPSIDIHEIKKYCKWRKKSETKEMLFSMQFGFDDIDKIIIEKETERVEFQGIIMELPDFSTKEKESLCLNIESAEKLKPKTIS
jgi:hypothetical protein